ncbi:CobB/CobQ domain protein glutamine amidotransferase [Methanocaldococcus infernus ME]|uniref:CobB/CobQ domain protein glutamine amidotransferase n=1 Tax=Methanocaldococcus infernus (strain DSM 11812 / JCM 15783 / ME) TaxID=573063 RepID=D5VQG8_METIM|nr:AAA family ATPase [Methanocaldococcus infernus]ADG12821.1 CobB/CobQ domain protein glutamine amidotransferase [Methanocaldococcus infernus ME]
MEIGILDIKSSLPCFETFGYLPTKIVDENNLNEIKNLDALIIPGGSLIERGVNLEVIREFDGYIIGICSGFQILGERIDIGRKSEKPKIVEGLGLLEVEFSPLVCTDWVKFKAFDNIEGEGFHCHTYGDVKIYGKTKVLTVSKVKKLNYKFEEKEIISGAYKNKVFGTLVHRFLDNREVRDKFFEIFKVSEEEKEEIFKKNKILREELRKRALAYKEYKESLGKRGVVLLGTSSNAGKTLLTTSLTYHLDGKVFVAKIGGDVRDIVPSLYLLREEMSKYNSIEIGGRGWCSVEEFKEFVKNSKYNYYIVEGVMGVLTGALKNISSYQVAKKLGFPVYIIASCNLSGIEGAFLESLIYKKFLEENGVKVEGIILNKVYNFELFEKIKKLAEKYNIKVCGVKKLGEEKRGLIPEVEIDYHEFCKKAKELNLKLEIPKISLREVEEEEFLKELDKFMANLLT